MSMKSVAIRRLEKMYDKLNQLKNEADKEAYYYRKDLQLSEYFGSFGDALNNAVSSMRETIRSAQTMNGYICPCVQKKQYVKPATKKVTRR